jgi:hypothetical protein
MADSWEFDRKSEWCGTSVTTLAGGITRAASFYAPEVEQGSLPPLPGVQDTGLKAECGLGGI